MSGELMRCGRCNIIMNGICPACGSWTIDLSGYDEWRRDRNYPFIVEYAIKGLLIYYNKVDKEYPSEKINRLFDKVRDNLQAAKVYMRQDRDMTPMWERLYMVNSAHDLPESIKKLVWSLREEYDLNDLIFKMGVPVGRSGNVMAKFFKWAPCTLQYGSGFDLEEDPELDAERALVARVKEEQYRKEEEERMLKEPPTIVRRIHLINKSQTGKYRRKYRA